MTRLLGRKGDVGVNGRAKCRIIDLSLPIDGNMPGVNTSAAKSLATDGWNATTLSLYSHCGTHMDAPCHFVDGSTSIDELPLEAFWGPAKVLDLTPVQPRELLTIERFALWADEVRPGDRLLVRTDWHRKFGTEAYRNELPRISIELAHWLVSKDVSLIGVEPPSVADVNNITELSAVHQTLFDGGVVVVEGLANLDKLRQNVVEFVAIPLRIRGGDGSPVRAIARESDR